MGPKKISQKLKTTTNAANIMKEDPGLEEKKNDADDNEVAPVMKSIARKRSYLPGYLVIVESPSKCAKIEHFLGLKYKCIASKGHLRYIDGLENIDIKGGSYHVTYSLIDDKSKHISAMEKTIKQYDPENIYLASDDDREGEAIAWHICDIFGLDVEKTKRIVFHEITKPAVIAAVQSPRLVDMHLVRSQIARQILDIIIGFKVSPVLWKHISRSKNNPLSAGRCQTPALRLIYDNQKLIDESSHNLIYKTTSHFFSKNIIFGLDKDFESQTDIVEFLEKSKSFEHMMSVSESKMVSKSPPKPFNTARLLQTASSLLRIAPKQTMDYCQQLYQEGFITYMRTDSQKYSKEFIDKADKYIKEAYGDDFIGDASKIMNNNSADPHEAIRVTSLDNRTINCEERKMAALYNLIWKNSIESCMKEATYKATTIWMTAPFGRTYSRVIEIPIFYGWKKVGADGSTTEEVNSENGLLFYIQSIDKTKHYSPNSIYCTANITHKHLHYTEASLIQKLEEIGIGRPSTFSQIVETNIEKLYVQKKDVPPIVVDVCEYSLINGIIQGDSKKKEFCQEKGKLVISPVGKICIEFLTQHFEKLFSYNYTSIMETLLDKIADGTEDVWFNICNNCYDEIKECVNKLKNVDKPVYKLKDNDDYVVTVENNKLLMRKVIDNSGPKPVYEYKQVNIYMTIDYEKLKNGEYTYEELADINNPVLGLYSNKEVVLKNGKYGYYIEWGINRCAIKSLNIEPRKLTLKDVLPLIYEKEGIVIENKEDIEKYKPPAGARKLNGLLRVLNDDFCIRSGKFGPYVAYKSKGMEKTQFFSLNNFKSGFLTCPAEELLDWVCTKNNLPRFK